MPTSTTAASAHTGERPGRGLGFAYDEARHLAAYRLARDLARDLEVLDAGCGEGFGTVLLAETARRVIGIDYAREAVEAARASYAIPNLEFRQLDVGALPRLDLRFDLVTNFQVIEHLTDPAGFLRAVRSVLKPDGVLVLTTPNRLTTISENPYHVREYTADELAALLRPIFTRVELRSMMGNAKVRAFDAARARQVRRILRLDPLGLRRLLPDRLVRFAFGKLSVLVRRRVTEREATAGAIGPDDFHVAAESRPDALDLVALCRP
jgi:SAM-dependent methyltransferase